MNRNTRSILRGILFALQAFIFSQLTDISSKASFLALIIVILQCINYHVQDSS